MAGNPTRAAIYARISDDREGRELGVQRQVPDCKTQAERMGWQLSPDSQAIFIENDVGASTRSKKRRPQFEALMAGVRAGEYDGIVYYSTSRLTRRPREFEDIISLVEETGVCLASCTTGLADLTTADGRMIARILAAQDAAESERIGERGKRQQQQRREAGLPHATGMRAFGFGWTDEGGGHHDLATINAAEAEEIRRGVGIILDGGSLGDVLRDWTERGVAPVQGGRWSRMTVRRALTRPRVAGLVEHNERRDGRIVKTTVTAGVFGEIIDAETWEKVKAAVADRSSLVRARYAGREHLLSGFIWCGVCAGRMKVSARRDERGEVRADSFVSCQKEAGGCGKVKRNLLLLEAFVFEVVEAKLATVQPFDPDADDTADGREYAQLVTEREKVERKIADLRSLYEQDDTFEAADFVPMNTRLRAKLNEVEAKMREFAHGPSLGELADDIGEVWQSGGFDERREILEALSTQVTVHPIGKVGPVRARMMVPETTSVDFLA